MHIKNPTMKKISKTLAFIFLFTLSISVLGQKCCEENKFSFVFLTDIHVQPELDADKGLMKAISKVNELNPDFVITGGYLIMDALGQTKERSDSLYLLYKKLQNSFEMPVYNTIGNHEHYAFYM